MYDTWLQMTRFLRSGQFDPTPVITHRFPLEQPTRRSGSIKSGEAGKVIFEVALTETHDTATRKLRRESLEDTIEQLEARSTSLQALNYLDSPQSARVQMEGRGDVLILSSNNYLGLCDEPSVVEAGIDGLEEVRRGHGERALHLRHVHDPPRARGRRSPVRRHASRRCRSCRRGTRTKRSRRRSSQEGDFVVSDALNHASIIDSIRLAKAITKCTTAVYKHGDMDDLRREAREAKGCEAPHDLDRRNLLDGRRDREAAGASCRSRAITNSIVIVDDSHATGVLGKTGRGTAEHFGVLGEVDIITSTLGKALGGAAGGFVAGPEALCDYAHAARASAAVLERAAADRRGERARGGAIMSRRIRERVETLRENTQYFREQITEAGFKPLPGETPIVPIIVGETAAAIRMSDMLLDEGVFVTGFGFPVVPQGTARVRCQISAAHTRDDLDEAIRAFKKVGGKLGLL